MVPLPSVSKVSKMRSANAGGYFCVSVLVNCLRLISFLVEPAIFLNAATAFLYASSFTVWRWHQSELDGVPNGTEKKTQRDKPP